MGGSRWAAEQGSVWLERLAASAGDRCWVPSCLGCPQHGRTKPWLPEQGWPRAGAERPSPGLSLPPGLFFPLMPARGLAAAPARPSPPGDDKSVVCGAKP